MSIQDLRAIDAMTYHGGNFVRALAHAAVAADPENLELIVRDQVSPLAFGATPCASKDRDESPAGMGINCIALFAFSVFELRIAQLVLVIVGCLIVIWVLGKSLFEHYRELNSRKNKEDNREQK